MDSFADALEHGAIALHGEDWESRRHPVDGGATNCQAETEIASPSIRLGSLEVRPGARAILLDGAPVALGSRAFDVLMTLINARGRILSKDAIMREVWPTTTVEENNLRVQLSCLRHALGDERWRIKTIPGRGYLLVADTSIDEDAEAPLGPGLAEASGMAIFIVIARAESIERLRPILANAGALVESVTSPSLWFGLRKARFPLPPSGPVHALPAPKVRPTSGAGRAPDPDEAAGFAAHDWPWRAPDRCERQ